MEEPRPQWNLYKRKSIKTISSSLVKSDSNQPILKAYLECRCTCNLNENEKSPPWIVVVFEATLLLPFIISALTLTGEPVRMVTDNVVEMPGRRYFGTEIKYEGSRLGLKEKWRGAQWKGNSGNIRLFGSLVKTYFATTLAQPVGSY